MSEEWLNVCVISLPCVWETFKWSFYFQSFFLGIGSDVNSALQERLFVEWIRTLLKQSASDLCILRLTFPRRPWDFCSFSNDWKVASSLPVLITGWNGVNWLERFFFLWERAESPGTDPVVNSLYVCLRPIHMQRLDTIIKSWHLHLEKQKWNGVLIKNLLVTWLVHETDGEGVISEPFCEICF